MIHKKQGNILQVTNGIIVHQVNCQGVMGSGIAKQIKDKYPKVYQDYVDFCQRKKFLSLGSVQPVQITTDLWIYNIFGQELYGKDGKRYTSYDALDSAFDIMANHYCANKVYDIHFPRIGCGLGGGKWPIVESIIQTHLSKHNLFLWEL